MKCWNPAFQAQGSRVFIVVAEVEVGAVKIYVATVEVLKEKKKEGDKTQFTTKIGEKS